MLQKWKFFLLDKLKNNLRTQRKHLSNLVVIDLFILKCLFRR